MRLSVLFPFRRGDPDRDAAAEWVMAGWASRLPEFDLFHSGDDSLPAGGDWSKAEHLAHLLQQAGTADIIVVHDVDCWVPPEAIRLAVDKVASGEAPWAVPHRNVRRLTRAASQRFMSRPAPADEVLVHDSDLAEYAYPGVAGGGVVVLPRRTALEVPLDPRYRGWGQEDTSWGLALSTMVGEPWRGSSDLVHLWHTPAKRLNRGWGNEAGIALYQRYVGAAELAGGAGREAMAELLGEIR